VSGKPGRRTLPAGDCRLSYATHPPRQAVELTGLPGAVDAFGENGSPKHHRTFPPLFSRTRPQPPGKCQGPFSSAPWKTGPQETAKTIRISRPVSHNPTASTTMMENQELFEFQIWRLLEIPELRCPPRASLRWSSSHSVVVVVVAAVVELWKSPRQPHKNRGSYNRLFQGTEESDWGLELRKTLDRFPGGCGRPWEMPQRLTSQDTLSISHSRP